MPLCTLADPDWRCPDVIGDRLDAMSVHSYQITMRQPMLCRVLMVSCASGQDARARYSIGVHVHNYSSIFVSE